MGNLTQAQRCRSIGEEMQVSVSTLVMKQKAATERCYSISPMPTRKVLHSSSSSLPRRKVTTSNFSCFCRSNCDGEGDDAADDSLPPSERALQDQDSLGPRPSLAPAALHHTTRPQQTRHHVQLKPGERPSLSTSRNSGSSEGLPSDHAFS